MRQKDEDSIRETFDSIKDDIDKRFNEFVSCEDCGVLVRRGKAKIVVMINNVGDSWEYFYCREHEKPYDKMVAKDNGIEYYKNQKITEKGRKVKEK